MARQIKWTQRAQKERIEILTFWNNHNKSAVYSRKLNGIIKDSLKLIGTHPFIGKPTNKASVRVKVLKNYLIVYEVTPDEIVVLSIWDGRRNPEDLRRIRR